MRKKLLLADDSITIQKVVELTFPSDEFEVVTAGNGRIAIDKATTFLPDIVLCDVIMPQIDGYQVCEALRAMPELRDVPILLLNGAFEPYDAERARSVGALGNVSKPFDPPALVSRVKEILAERAPRVEPDAQPQSVDDLTELEPHSPEHQSLEHHSEDVTVDGGIPPSTLPHDFSYDDSGASPISTTEVPWGVRETAAQSLALDTPVFASPEPEAFTLESEPSDFSETLSEQDLDSAPMELVDDAEAPVAADEDSEAPGTLQVAEAPTSEFVLQPTSAEESLEFEAEQSRTEEPLRDADPPVVQPSEDAREFALDEIDTQTAEIDLQRETFEEAPPAPDVPLEMSEPDALAQTGEFAALEPLPMVETETEPARAPAPPPAAPAEAPAPQVPVSSPMAVQPTRPEEPAAVAGTDSFKGLLEEAEPAPLASRPASVSSPKAAAPGVLPSAEVAVPVDMVQQIAQRVISQVSERVIREIAWDVIPGLTEKLIRAEIERIKARVESERD